MEFTEVKLAIISLTLITLWVVIASIYGIPVSLEAILSTIIAAIAGLAGYDTGFNHGKTSQENQTNDNVVK